ncbi:MAG: pyrrolo-quinoline quinone [Acidobacteria bacterium]|jgi:outer membrane protein assembly factor BamB|nr:pyrrolo-quinoline quinone [Acidobacteriota bacterium]MDP7339177.1 PQQ-like beta-propeller repeat protein [Vicinamibacterales bacterium]MDP7479736.1 PQQ-like beta-propeller repeat protein [Vicinamibacterales bacterium]HJN45907.1 PQQ-binding-like beta-propeller repeat protein [Vicinamibacterales bacterium]
MTRVAASIVGLFLCGTVHSLHANDWPEWRGAGRLGILTETGLVDTFPTAGLPVAWRTPIHSGYSGAAVATGRVFITDARRPDPRSTAVVERALALDEQTGQVLWTREWETDYAGLQLVYAIGPRATPTVDDDRVYVLGAMGNLLALDVATGDVLWQKDYARDFNTAVPSWGMTGAPLVDGDRLICLVGGEPDAKMMAFDKRTGAEIWRALSSDWEPGYSQPIIIEAGGVRQLIAWHPRDISSLDPETGEIYWEVRHIVDMGINPATPVQSGRHLFVTSQYGGARMLALDEATPGASVLWEGVGESDPEYGRDFNTLNSVISTPLIQGDYVYGVDGHGVLRCLEIATGRRVWETEALIGESTNWATAFFVRHEDRYFINTDTGDLVIAKLSPEGYREISRTHLIDPTHPYVRRRRSGPAVNWSHPAYANRHIVVRNDEEIVRFSLASER